MTTADLRKKVGKEFVASCGAAAPPKAAIPNWVDLIMNVVLSLLDGCRENHDAKDVADSVKRFGFIERFAIRQSMSNESRKYGILRADCVKLQDQAIESLRNIAKATPKAEIVSFVNNFESLK